MSTIRCPHCNTRNKNSGINEACGNCGKPLKKPFPSTTILITGIGVALLGIILCVCTTLHAYSSKSAETVRAENDLKIIQKQMKQNQERSERLKDLLATATNQLKSLKKEHADKKETLTKREKSISAIEAEMAARMDKVEKRLAEENKLARREEDIVVKALVDKKVRELRQKQIERILNNYKLVVATIETEDGRLGTGTFIDVFDQTRLMTANSVVHNSTTVTIKMYYTLAKDKNTIYSGIAEGRVVYRDKLTGLAFIALTRKPKAEYVGTRFARRGIGTAKVGQQAYTLAAQLVGEALLEHNAFDGQISSAKRKFGNLEVMQTTFPANPGSLGAPIVDTSGKLIGINLGKLEDLEKTSFAVPGECILQAIERARGK